MCECFGVSRTAYYQRIKHLSQPDRDRMELVQVVSEKSRCTYGYQQIVLWIREHKGAVINQKVVLRLMNKLNIHSVAKKYKFTSSRQN
jgi:putative transposase